ncbi:hypothetical protein BJ912DRAFT_1040829, partial [Pholiota molesta]
MSSNSHRSLPSTSPPHPTSYAPSAQSSAAHPLPPTPPPSAPHPRAYPSARSRSSASATARSTGPTPPSVRASTQKSQGHKRDLNCAGRRADMGCAVSALVWVDAEVGDEVGGFSCEALKGLRDILRTTLHTARVHARRPGSRGHKQGWIGARAVDEGDALWAGVGRRRGRRQVWRIRSRACEIWYAPPFACACVHTELVELDIQVPEGVREVGFVRVNDGGAPPARCVKRHRSGEVTEVRGVNELDLDAGRMETDGPEGEHLGWEEGVDGRTLQGVSTGDDTVRSRDSAYGAGGVQRACVLDWGGEGMGLVDQAQGCIVEDKANKADRRCLKKDFTGIGTGEDRNINAGWNSLGGRSSHCIEDSTHARDKDCGERSRWQYELSTHQVTVIDDADYGLEIESLHVDAGTSRSNPSAHSHRHPCPARSLQEPTYIPTVTSSSCALTQSTTTLVGTTFLSRRRPLLRRRPLRGASSPTSRTAALLEHPLITEAQSEAPNALHFIAENHVLRRWCGVSLISSSWQVWDELALTRPDLVKVFSEPLFHGTPQVRCRPAACGRPALRTLSSNMRAAHLHRPPRSAALLEHRAHPEAQTQALHAAHARAELPESLIFTLMRAVVENPSGTQAQKRLYQSAPLQGPAHHPRRRLLARGQFPHLRQRLRTIAAAAYTTGEQAFHTDVGDVISLSVLQTAVEGVVSRISSSWRVYSEHAGTRPALSSQQDAVRAMDPRYFWLRMIIQYARRLFTRFLALPCSGHIPHINDVLDTLRFFVVKHALGLRFRQGDIQHQQPERLPRARWVRPFAIRRHLLHVCPLTRGEHGSPRGARAQLGEGVRPRSRAARFILGTSWTSVRHALGKCVEGPSVDGEGKWMAYDCMTSGYHAEIGNLAYRTRAVGGKALRGALGSIFDRKQRAEDGSGSERVDSSQTTMGREIPVQRETTQRETRVNQSQGQITNDADPVANAMFNNLGKVAIYGGRFVQNITMKSDKHGFELLQKRVASSAFHNSAQRVDPPRCHPDTRVDIMQAIYDWIIRSGYRDEYLLWLNGAAGAGKSAIMQSIAERCVLAAIAVASFFFVRSDSTRNSMASLVATLAYQLIQAIPETADDILLTIERNPLIFQQSLEDQLRELIIQPLLRLPPHLQRLFVVFIDGLDECNDRAHQSNLLKILGNVSSGRNIPVVFLIASRREPQIEAEFCRNQVTDILTTIPLDDIQASDDIRRYLNAKFKEIKNTHLRRRSLAPDWPTSTVIEQIVEKSSGQFIYASVIIGYVSLPHAHPALQLDIINNIRPRNPSENLFAHLNALYHYIFSQVKQLDAVRNVLALQLIHRDGQVFLSDIESLFQLAAGELEVL